MAQLGINDTVDTISADHLDRLRKELAAIGEALPERVMIRVADAMHDACTTAFACGESEARDVVSEDML